ncbi:hypothetical protein NDA11_007760 [Ustilago hordei]|uniref:Probable RNA-binding protein 18 n=1 Tax=Ustilago hordei TaxID=120017 RepID=I2FUS3_USTHO|nr:uncharacterized protein UHO2_07255 [Ustilago hordei]KAJ1040803.1 hypothetical protein NDA10_003170 [Ustilago hordei]KAJ1576282.1 hypothetical protein NDA12_000007 [Ustilago hordei]KAJ1577810.1 hypothetical protein NDA15_003835 [Ustilago hordei]KAJ1596558.1 hypothetical protein NDA11_007760 [Ustilago hordei]UTT90500.1 hypothetical protein NDA17_000291 [Ustilago hordei]
MHTTADNTPPLTSFESLSGSRANANANANTYLTRPTTSCSAPSACTPTSSKTAGKHESRLYIGNLHATVDEYTLISTFSKFGKISKLDFLFHKSGPQRGQARGYAFVEYASAQEALEAVVGAHDKTLRGRKISVKFASKNDESGAASGAVGPQRRDRRAGAENETIKISRQAKQRHGTDAKIAAMEAKLAKMRQAKAPPTAAPSSSMPSGTGKASLPAKPNLKPANETTKSRQQPR